MKNIVTYLNFEGNCREAMEFYKKSLGADLELMPFSGMPGDFPEEMKHRIMHARLSKGSQDLLMASDTMPGHGLGFKAGNNFWVSVHCESAEEIDRIFTALSEKGQVVMPLAQTFWSARFGMLTDRFGINWMLNFENTSN